MEGNWPAPFPKITLPYSYNSIDNGDSLFYQQLENKANSVQYSLYVPSAFNARFEVGYDFLVRYLSIFSRATVSLIAVSDLHLRLYSLVDSTWYYGVNGIDNNVLSVSNLPAGNYTLYLREPTGTPSAIVGCNYIDFSVYIEAYAADILKKSYTT